MKYIDKLIKRHNKKLLSSAKRTLEFRKKGVAFLGLAGYSNKCLKLFIKRLEREVENGSIRT